MAKKNHTKKALISSLLALFICFTMLIGTTFAWFTDTAVSSGNRIQAGKLEIGLELLQGDNWVDASDTSVKIFDYDKWEPGYTDVKVLRVVNNGTLALKWQASLSASAEFTELAKVIDVYVCPSEDTVLSMPADRDLTGYNKVGTLAEFAKTMETTTQGVLLPAGKTGNANVQPHEVEKEAYLGIALKMQEDAGNEYQGMSLIKTDDAANNGYFNINIFATQYTYEADSFNNQYDKDAEFATVVTNNEELTKALAAGKTNLLLMPGEYTANLYDIDECDSLTINGSGAETKLEFARPQVRASQFKNLTINNCTIERMPDKSWGHLVFASSTTPGGVYTISNCVFNGEGSQGIFINQNVPATFNIKNCTFNNNFGSEGAITIQNNGVDITVNVTGCEFKTTSHEICILYRVDEFTLNVQKDVTPFWAAKP